MFCFPGPPLRNLGSLFYFSLGGGDIPLPKWHGRGCHVSPIEDLPWALQILLGESSFPNELIWWSMYTVDTRPRHIH